MIDISKLCMLSVHRIYFLRLILILLRIRKQRSIYLKRARVSGFRAG
jgi:hypothetical protein